MIYLYLWRRRTTAKECVKLMREEAERMFEEDIAINRAIAILLLARDVNITVVWLCFQGHHGAEYLRSLGHHKLSIIHHCNTGFLATAGYGTALGVVYSLHESDPGAVEVFVDETRPRLQGAKLTCWELSKMNVPHKLIVDGASGFLMYQKRVHAVVFGADRVAANGDVANKIGTHNLALCAHTYGLPVLACVPCSTVDLTAKTGSDIEVEERPCEEITLQHALRAGYELCPPGTAVYNPAFDITPAKFITAIVTEAGLIFPPFEQELRRAKDMSISKEMKRSKETPNSF
eukprot:GHVQ01023869.1.p1 GENE.GHVQ01023869.1~~GHVQ01023869.1.p1  ORF type:complete len:290 (+),score=32.94 GHVQ01023869.1:743-1612(+)